MKKKGLKFLVLVLFVCITSCEKESTCQFEKNCFSDGNGGQRCVDRPIPGTCIDNNFGF